MRAAKPARPSSGKSDIELCHPTRKNYAHGYEWRTTAKQPSQPASDSAMAIRALFGSTATTSRPPKRAKRNKRNRKATR